MAKKIQAIRGMHDILPEHSPIWQHLEDQARAVLESYGYRELRTPLVEVTELFKRSIGEVTDIVEKEMYSFEDRGGDMLALRPEGTASCVRAAIEHGLLDQPQRIWYRGPMFRRERPQRGRYRQFHQIGVEVFGLDGPDIDLEVILITRSLWRALGLGNLRLEINSLGDADERARYREKLVAYLQSHQVVAWLFRRFGGQRVMTLLAGLRQGRGMNESARLAFGQTLEQLQKKWAAEFR